jgi:lysophospholipid acyltransferase (LPLAT)-like uncharacterized protein
LEEKTNVFQAPMVCEHAVYVTGYHRPGAGTLLKTAGDFDRGRHRTGKHIEESMTLLSKAASFVAGAVLSLWSRSLMVTFVNKDIPDRFASQERNVIFAFWHGSLFLLPYTHRNSGAIIMVSESRDGEIMSGLLKYFGFEVTRGSSRRKGDRGLLGLVRALRKGRSVAIAVDGPRGPLHEAKEGAVFLAASVKAPIIPVGTGAKRYRVLEKSWDKLVLPVPFTEGVVLYGEPIVVNGNSKEEIESKRRELEMALRRLTQEAAAWAAAPREGDGSVIKDEPRSSEGTM